MACILFLPDRAILVTPLFFWTWLYTDRSQEMLRPSRYQPVGKGGTGNGTERRDRVWIWCSKNICTSNYVTQWISLLFMQVWGRIFCYLLLKEFKFARGLKAVFPESSGKWVPRKMCVLRPERGRGRLGLPKSCDQALRIQPLSDGK